MANAKDDGFFQLIPRKKSRGNGLRLIDAAKEDKKPKVKKAPKFKKGSWKRDLQKRLKRIYVPKSVEEFHDGKVSNLLLDVSGKKPRASFFAEKPKPQILKDLNGEAYVLVNAGDGMYMKISLKAYRKLCGIDRMLLDFTLTAEYDDGELVDVYHAEYPIASITELAHFINYHRSCIDGVYDTQAQCYGFCTHHFKFKALVNKADGSVETYKGDLNDFMKKYHLRLF